MCEQNKFSINCSELKSLKAIDSDLKPLEQTDISFHFYFLHAFTCTIGGAVGFFSICFKDNYILPSLLYIQLLTYSI